MSSKKKFLNYVGSKFGESIKKLIIKNELVIVEMKKPIKTSNMSAEETEDYKYDREDYQRFKQTTQTGLLMAYSILWGLCHVSLQNKTQAHPDFDAMEDGDVGELFQMLSNICNGCTTGTTEDTILNIMDALYNWLFIKGDDFLTLSEYMEGFENSYDVTERAGFNIANIGLRDLYMMELENQGHEAGATYTSLNRWKLAADDADGRRAVKAGVVTLMNAFKAHVYVKQSGSHFLNFQLGLQNNHMAGNTTFPVTVVDANQHMEYWRPSVLPHASKTTVTSTSCLQDNVGSAGHKFIYFKCNCEGHGMRECSYEIKEDGLPLNIRAEIDQQYEAMKQMRRDNSEEYNNDNKDNKKR